MRTLFVLLFGCAVSLSASQIDHRTIAGVVVGQSGRAIAGAQVALRIEALEERQLVTDSAGRFAFHEVPAGAATVIVKFSDLPPTSFDVERNAGDLRLVLSATPLSEAITVTAAKTATPRIATATKTNTPLRDVPQAITVISRDDISETSMQSMADVVRYTPGIGMAQGEGNRDAPVFRGNSSTSDFYIDGIRDDVQYFRDLYNVERVEALKGPNAMIFGRGGSGGVINRVTRQADWKAAHQLTLQAGSWNDRRIAGDFNQPLSDAIAARMTGVYEHSDSYRAGAGLEREGVNPTLTFVAGANTIIRAGYEYFHDRRTADRGISSFDGSPVETTASTFFGNADMSHSDATVNALFTAFEHRFKSGSTLQSRISHADYDKFYQNVFPGAVDSAGTNVSISAYNNATKRRNTFSQTDLVMSRRTGNFEHTILAGLEVGRQVTDNFRNTGYFTSLGGNVTSVLAPLTNPTITLPITFRQGATDADNHGTTRVAAIYVQDQIALSPRLRAVAGIRYDRFNVDLHNNRTSVDLSSSDNLISPRLGLIYKPADEVSLYASYSVSYLPRAGEQLSSLTLSNQALDPETFRNYEIGLKWDIQPAVSLTTSIYRLDRGNVVAADPLNPAQSILVDGQQSRGIELGMSGQINDRWNLIGSYAFQDGEITTTLSPSAVVGARLAHLPEHSLSLWNKYDVTRIWSAGLGVIHRDSMFTSTDNSVVLPGFTRIDAAIFLNLSERLTAQINVENVLDTKYYASAHSNTNISPGSPRAIRLSWTNRF